jgi:3-hydroxyisobutyrate dehydrogenase-like beta-hydroxyacid dehydrogenase
MGSKMSANLSTWLHANSYPPLLLWNRTASKLPSESDSIKHAASIKELAEKCDVVITSLANDEVAKDVFAQLFEGVKSKQEKGLKENTYFVESSTLYPLTVGEFRCSVLFSVPLISFGGRHSSRQAESK